MSGMEWRGGKDQGENRGKERKGGMGKGREKAKVWS